MSKNKQDRRAVNKQEITYAELKGCISQQKRKVPNTDLIDDLPSDQQVSYVELRFAKASCPQDRKHPIRKKRKVCQVVAGSLGVLCMLLMTAVGVLLVKLFSRKEQNQNTTVPTVPSKNDECSCHRCMEPWIEYGESCYRIFTISKTWEESRAACAELKSHLLKIETKEELETLSSVLDVTGWIGFKINENSGLWLWEDGTEVIKELLTMLKNDKHCGYLNGNMVDSDVCSSMKRYVCEYAIQVFD